jgi:formylglycine-generating enzyme required for sulfatase activity
MKKTAGMTWWRRAVVQAVVRGAVLGLVLGLVPGLGGCTIEQRGYEPPAKATLEAAPAVDRAQMVHIVAGSFLMGHPDADPGLYGAAWKENEMPAHDVTLSEFWIDRTEVTAAAYALFLSLAAGEKHFVPNMPIERAADVDYVAIAGREKRPVNHLSWLAAAEYCAWRGMRLPTEAEWERTAKGNDTRRWPWGEEGPDCLRANHYRGSSYCEGAAVDVGSYTPDGDSLEGAQDMAGNVAEWVSDMYQPYSAEAANDPTGPSEGWWRVVRGGGYNESGAAIRTTARWPADPTKGSPGIGFRCVATAEGVAP